MGTYFTKCDHYEKNKRLCSICKIKYCGKCFQEKHEQKRHKCISKCCNKEIRFLQPDGECNDCYIKRHSKMCNGCLKYTYGIHLCKCKKCSKDVSKYKENFDAIYCHECDKIPRIYCKFCDRIIYSVDNQNLQNNESGKFYSDSIWPSHICKCFYCKNDLISNDHRYCVMHDKCENKNKYTCTYCNTANVHHGLHHQCKCIMCGYINGKIQGEIENGVCYNCRLDMRNLNYIERSSDKGKILQGMYLRGLGNGIRIDIKSLSSIYRNNDNYCDCEDCYDY